MFDIIIKNGQIVTHTDVFEAEVAIQEGKIAAIGKNLGDAKRVIDAKGNFVMPGCIDPHNHIGMFVPYDKDLEGETRAALIGGNTMVMNCVCDNYGIMENIRRMKDPIAKYAYCDIGLYTALLTADDIDKIPEISAMGINSFKFFMAYKGKYAASLNLDGVLLDNGYMWEAFQRIKKVGGLAMFHAENTETASWIEPKFHKDNELKSYDDGRPTFLEEMDLYTVCLLGEELGVPIYQVHSSVARNPDIVREFRQRGNKVILETCPQYSIVDYYGSDYRQGDAKRTLKEPRLGKINPPIRSPKERDGMRRNMAAGEYDVLATDSANSMYKDKKADGNIWNMILDWSSAGLMLPMALDNFVNEGLLTMPDIVRMTSYNTARVHGYSPKKGVMAPGADADIIIVDLNKEKILEAGKTAPSWSDWCLYEGWKVKGWPVLTILRGEVVMENDEVLVKPGYGQFVKSKPAFIGYKGPKE